jgi:hypothetical protein
LDAKRYIGTLGLLLFCLVASAQKVFNLTAEQVRIDSLLPVVSYSHPLGYGYADSAYQVTIEYPEFIPMSEADVARYHAITDAPLPSLPEVVRSFSVTRKQGVMHLSLVPLVYRDGQYQKLVSFVLKVKGERLSKKLVRQNARHRATAASSRYATNSVLSSGNWVKICVPATGIYQLTEDYVRQLGFSSLSKVKVYGYGGGRQPEVLTGDYLTQTDDLKEVSTFVSGNRKLFHAIGPVTWDNNHRRVRNPYSNYGCYFLTENDEAAQTVEQEAFLAACYPLADDYCSLYEVDDYAWFHGGRNLYDARQLNPGSSYNYTVASTGTSATGTLTVLLSAAGSTSTTATVSLNDVSLGTITISANSSLEKMRTAQRTFNVTNLQASNTVTITIGAGTGVARLDYISTYASQPKAAPDLAQAFPQPESLYRITNQNHHAAKAADMVIIIPMTQQLRAQAERLKTIHEQRDGLRVNIVPADELFNEFSSGTPDANAYRRYMKMLYDRAESDADMPRYLLLLGDGAWDNRMILSDWQGESPDNFLLCYESENSYSEVDCYVSDDYFCLLDDGEGGNMLTSDMADAAVGRISARTAAQATVAVDKIESYIKNEQAGAWQNLICFMGDDGNQNQHMKDADSVATMTETLYPDYHVKRIMWDAYTRVSSSTGHSYPDVTRLIKQQMQQGALMMNYSGHGRADAVSHEYVLRLSDFAEATSLRLPLWMTASCDIMPFDGQEENIGETALFNTKGGAIAFFGTTRTVYQNYNRLMNIAFTRHVLGKDADNKSMPVGEAARRAKNELISTGIWIGREYRNGQWVDVYSGDRTANKLQYSLLGDPALRLASPTRGIVLDAINDTPVDGNTMLTLKAGTTATATGHILGEDGTGVDETFNGMMTAVVRDIREQITCKLNDTGDADAAFVYYDRPNIVFNGSNDVKDGKFTFSFAVPKDIKYSDASALINLYAINAEKTVEASGTCSSLTLNGTDETIHGATGPNIYCYLNSVAFVNGGAVNTTPYFYAELTDEDGINASGSSIGHDLQLIIDGDLSKTYTLNDYFTFDYGSYTKGHVGYSIPALTYGDHKLQFRAWDVLNNSSTVELNFKVVKGLEPNFADVQCSPNPASQHTSFRVIHDRVGTSMDIKLDVFDTSGRLLWTRSESGVATDNTYTIDWDLTCDGGRRLNTGLYLYRVSISSDGSSYASKAKKLIIINHK